MKLIQTLNDKITEEIHDAQSYATMALELKDERKSLADVLYQLSTEEMKHMSMLHNEVVKIIDEFRRTKGEPPAPDDGGIRLSAQEAHRTGQGGQTASGYV